MKAFECPVQVTAEGKLEIPPGLAKQLSHSHAVRAIFLVSDSDVDDDASWDRLTADQFVAGYSEADAIYDRI